MIQEVLAAIRDWANPKFAEIGKSTDPATKPTVHGKLSELATKVGEYDDGKSIATELKSISDNLSAVDSDIVNGKKKLALAITSKGVVTDWTDDLTKMSENVHSIHQTVNTGSSNFDEMVAPSEYMWNIYKIAEDMLKPNGNPHPEMGAFFVAEYYRGYDSLVLTGADAYLTCDGDFYQTLDKTAEVNHIWHDADNGKSNRYVVFYYMQDGYAFSNATAELCPRRVALGGRCASFIVTEENRLTDVYVLGTLEHFEGGTTGTSWNPAQVIRNYPTHSSGSIYTNANLISCILPETKVLSRGKILNECSPEILVVGIETINGGSVEYLSTKGSSTKIAVLDQLKNVNGGIVLDGEYSVTGYRGAFESLQKIQANSLVELKGDFLHVKFYGTNMVSLNSLTSVSMQNLTTLSGKIFSVSPVGGDLTNGILPSLNVLELPKLERMTGYIVGANMWDTRFTNPMVGVKVIKLPSLTYCANGLFYTPSTSPTYSSLYNLIDLEVGELTTSLNVKQWRANNVIADPSKLAQLNANIREHIAAKVSDRTGQTALTFTVSTNLYNNLEQATKDAFTAKNWEVRGA